MGSVFALNSGNIPSTLSRKVGSLTAAFESWQAWTQDKLNHTLAGNPAADHQTSGARRPGAWQRTSWMLLAVLAGTAMWVYVLTMWPSSADKLSDLYPRWYGARELVLHHRDPYSPEVSREIQYWIFGRLAVPGEDQGRFAYPVYVSFLLWPTINSDFAVVNAVMFWVLLALGAGSITAFARFVGWPRSNYGLLLLVVLCGCSYPFAFAARLRQLSLLVGFLLAAALVLLAKNKLVLAGGLLALATIKPQLMVLLVPWLLLWTLSDWRHRHRLLWSFLLAWSGLAGISDLLVRGWIPEFLHSVSSYVGYTHAGSILDILLKGEIAKAVAVTLVAIVAVSCWQFRSREANSREFMFCTGLVLAISLVVIPTLAPHGQMLLIPGIFLLIRSGKTIWKGARVGRDALIGAGLIIGWPWVGAIGFSAAAIMFGFDTPRRFWLLPVSTIPLAPLAVGVALLLCRNSILATVD